MRINIRRAVFFTSVLLMAGSLAFSVIPNRKKQPRPIKTGVSGGNVNDQTSQFCCSGTIGALLKDSNGTFYLLSNNHVFAKSNQAHFGDPISQPGLIDANCAVPSSDEVANLSKFVKLKFGANTNNKMDAAIAEIIQGQVNLNGLILGVGNPGQPVQAALGMKCKKSGRTTGTTHGGTIDALNVTVSVRYSSSCGGPDNKLARFTGQIHIRAGAKKFSAGGDSGSLIVLDQKQCAPAVALLFAGDDFGNTTGSPINNVLTQLSKVINNVASPNLKIVGSGCKAAPTPTTTSTQMDMDMMAAKAVQAKHEDALMQIPGVVGVGIGLADPDSGSNQLAIVLFVQKGTTAEISKTAVPSNLDGMPVRRILSGEIKAF